MFLFFQRSVFLYSFVRDASSIIQSADVICVRRANCHRHCRAIPLLLNCATMRMNVLRLMNATCFACCCVLPFPSNCATMRMNVLRLMNATCFACCWDDCNSSHYPTKSASLPVCARSCHVRDLLFLLHVPDYHHHCDVCCLLRYCQQNLFCHPPLTWRRCHLLSCCVFYYRL